MPSAATRSFAAGQLSAAYSTNNRQPDGTARLEGAAGGLGFRTSRHRPHERRFHAPRSATVFNTGNSAVAGNGSLGYRGSWGSVRADSCYRDEKPELHDDATATPFQRIGDTRAGVTANLPIGASRLEVITGFERNRRREFEEAGADEVASGLLATSFKADVRFHHAPLGRLNGLVGRADLLRRLHRVRRGPAPDPEQPGTERRSLRLRAARRRPLDALVRRPATTTATWT